MRKATISAIEYYLPKEVITNSQLSSEFPEWSVEKIERKTGIVERHIAAAGECSSDLALESAKGLFRSGACRPDDLDFLLFCTQSPDYFLPTTACILQHRLGLPQSAGSLDFNLGCSGFIYGLGLATALIENGQARNVLLITAETYSKFISPGDKSVRTLFGDAGCSTLIRGIDTRDGPFIGPFLYGTDGSGAENLIVQTGGMRHPRCAESAVETTDNCGNLRSKDNLFMDGAEIFSFTMREVPTCVSRLLSRAGLEPDAVDLFVFHQANDFMLQSLRQTIGIPEEKFFVSLRTCGNTVSASIPIALKQASKDGKLKPGDLVMLVGFGVGYSWGATLVRWVDGVVF